MQRGYAAPKKQNANTIKLVRFAHNWNNGIMEYWSDGFKGVFDNLNSFFPLLPPIFQHSNIPFFQTDGINRLP
jgi:hypothetical protein